MGRCDLASYRLWPFFVALALCLSACDATSFADSTQQSAQGDTVVVGNRASFWSDTASLIPTVTIGAPEGPEEDILAHIIALAVGPDGSVYVYDGNLEALKKFGADGRYVGEIGRPGRGPGEIGAANAITVLADGRVIVSDPVNGRYNVYSAEGEVLSHWPRPPMRPLYGQKALRADASGSLMVGMQPRLPDDGSPEPWPRPLFVRYDGDGVPSDTVWGPARYVSNCVVSQRKYRSGFLEDIREPYVPKVKWAWSPVRGLVIGCSRTYDFDVISSDGSILRVARESWQATPVSRAELDDYKELQQQSKRETRTGPNFTWEGAELENHKPAYTYLLAGDLGRVWAWRPLASQFRDVEWRDRKYRIWGEPSGGGVFDIFDADGRYLGPVKLPDDVPFEPNPRTVDPVVRGDTVWAVRVDELDVQYVVKYRLTAPNPAL